MVCVLGPLVVCDVDEGDEELGAVAELAVVPGLAVVDAWLIGAWVVGAWVVGAWVVGAGVAGARVVDPALSSLSIEVEVSGVFPWFGVVFVFGTPVLAVEGGLESVVDGLG